MTEQGTTERGGSPLRDAARKVVHRLVEAGHEAYFAGGCVRDRLMGIEPADYDVATSATPDEIRAIYRKARGVGEAFGVMLVRERSRTIEVATFRTDGRYRDGRRPEDVEFTDAEHDARRRDFTINGLFEDPLQDRIIDFVGGRADLEQRIIRAIGDPEARLHEDRLRMLRAVRFAARFGFTIEPETAEAIRQGAGGLDGVSGERIGQELGFMLVDRNRVVAAWELQYLGLDGAILGEPTQTVAPECLGRLPDDAPYPTALAAWLLDRHPDHDEELLNIARRWAGRLVLSNADRDALMGSLKVFLVLCRDWKELGVARQKRLASSDHFTQGLILLRSCDRQAFVDVSRRVSDLRRTELAPEPFITGEDLIELGLEPGPIFKRVLDAVYDAQLEQTVQDREQALALASVLGRSVPGGNRGSR